MLFNTPVFFFFFIIFIFFYGFVFLRRTPKVYFILVSSLVFYGAWNYKFIPLLVGSAVGDYFLAMAIAGAATVQRKKLWLAASVTMNASVSSRNSATPGSFWRRKASRAASRTAAERCLACSLRTVGVAVPARPMTRE